MVPAIFALLFAGLPAQSTSQPFVQIAQRDSAQGEDNADRNRPDCGSKVRYGVFY